MVCVCVIVCVFVCACMFAYVHAFMRVFVCVHLCVCVLTDYFTLEFVGVKNSGNKMAYIFCQLFSSVFCSYSSVR